MKHIVHASPAHYQVRWAEAIQEGLRSLGEECSISTDKSGKADVTHVIGPHWAKQIMDRQKVVLHDRPYYGNLPADHPGDGWRTISWLEGGHRDYMNHGKDSRRWDSHVASGVVLCADRKTFGRTAYLMDYAQREADLRTDKVRYHPSTEKSEETLEEFLSDVHVVYARLTSALVSAVLLGCHAAALSPYNICHRLTQTRTREAWCHELAWCQWHESEVREGLFWEHLIRAE